MGWKTVIIGCECKASLSLNRLRITIGEEYQNIALCDIDTIIFTHAGITITPQLLSELVKNNVNVIICDEKNDPIGIFLAFNGHSLVFKQLSKQLDWKLTRKKKLWKTIIEHKIQSEIDVLNLAKKDKGTIDVLKYYKDSVYTNDQTNREAAAARYYFTSMFGNEFTRDDENVMNAGLNYGYKILASFISKCIASRGLLTQLGIHHIGESNPFNLTYDFIEPVRVMIDMWVVGNITDKFGSVQKRELIDIMNCFVFINGKWMRLCDAVEDVIDSYIAYLDERSDSVLRIDFSKGIKVE